MEWYFAPLEGITGYCYRQAHHEFFPGMDRYYTPFIAPNQNGRLTNREFMDVTPEHNQGITLIPQILTNRSQLFIETAKKLEQMGYQEINLNLGCPSGTVASKGRGAGFLAKKEELQRFLEDIFAQAVTEISIKTRIGRDSSKEWPALLCLFNEYPVRELIVHPRIQKDFYRNTPDLEAFALAMNESRCPVCYNGDINTKKDYVNLITRFPQLQRIMCGRGILRNPNLRGTVEREDGIDQTVLRRFHDQVYAGYRETMSGERNVLFKMKEFWTYLITIFPEKEKYGKRIKKTEHLAEYELLINSLFAETVGFCLDVC